ncbi:MAG: NAD(P)/FAD-dependent oxidoreductase [Candidatus Thermoplasmatota archaeon]|nr:NAD(P)/FAD-dependent oxidoreductase [Candidatus Thermoplasmatota archaeon]
MKEYDIIVVGAGPAGSMAAMEAAKQGARVLIIEKRQEAGSPVRCAEGVGKEGLLKTGIKIDNRWISNEVKGAKLIAPNRITVELSSEHAGNEVGFVLERKIFDRYLLCEAARQGADVTMKSSALGVIKDENGIRGVEVESSDGVHRIESKVVIACDGRESKVARSAGIDTKLKLKDMESCAEYLMVNVDYDEDFTHFYVGQCYAPGGYVWVFPKGEGIANVGTGVLGSKIGKRTGYPKELLDRFIKNNREFEDAKIVEHISGTVPVALPLEKTYIDGLLIAGDAAHLTDPITGGGIINAMVSGKLAGSVAAKHIYEHTDLSEYEKLWKKELESALIRDYIMKERFVNMSDNTLNLIADSLKDYRFSDLGMGGIIDAIREKHPELMSELEGLI